MAIPFGLLMFLIDGLDGNGADPINSMLKGLFFGLFMSLTMVTLHITQLKKNGVEKITAENIGVKHKKVVKSATTKEELIHQLKTDPILGKMKMSETENNIHITSNMTWKSMGERISIRFNPGTDHSSEYEISSKPIGKYTLVDNGSSWLNVNRIERLINKDA